MVPKPSSYGLISVGGTLGRGRLTSQYQKLICSASQCLPAIVGTSDPVNNASNYHLFVQHFQLIQGNCRTPSHPFKPPIPFPEESLEVLESEGESGSHSPEPRLLASLEEHG